MIDREIGSINNDSVYTYGFDFSGEQYIWPNIDTLYIIGKF